MKLSEIQAAPRLKLSQIIDNKDLSGPAYKYKDFGIAGLPGLNLGRGITAAKRGANIMDVPGLVVKAASGFYGDLPERIAERPLKLALAGLLGPSLRGTKPEAYQLPFPRPVTKEGKILGQELQQYSNVAGAGEAISSFYPLAQAGYDFLKLKRLGGATGAITKAEDELIKILQPQAKKLDIASKKGLDAPEAIKKSIPFVKPSKTYEELATNLGQTKKKVIQSRNQIIRGENYRIGEEYLIPLQDEINALKRQPQTESIQSEIREMEKILTSYRKFNSQRGFNRIQAQAHKERLQRETEPLLKRLASGESIQRSPTEIRALDKIRFGLMKMVEGGNPEVKRLNESFAALKETEALARHQANLSRKTTPTFFEKVPIVKDILQAVARSRAYPEQVALRALNVQPSLGKRTKNIAKLFELSRSEIKGTPKGIIPKTGQLPGHRIQAKQIAGPITSKRLDVSRSAGEGFERVLTKEEATRRLREFAFKYLKPEEKSKIVSIGEAFVSGRKKITPKKFGINPFTGEIKYGNPKTALQAAMERLRRKN